MGYIKRIKPELFHTQKRGGKGAKGISTIEDDYVEDVMTTTTHADIMFFTSKGRVYSLKAYGSRKVEKMQEVPPWSAY